MLLPGRQIGMILVLSLCVLGCQLRLFAQEFTMRGGYSSLFGAEGGSVDLRTDKYDGWVGVGGFDGNRRLGAHLQTQYHGLTVGAGDDNASFTLPTDMFTGGQYLLTRGLSLRAKHGGTDGFVFGGVSSLGYGTPWFQAAESDTPLGMIFLNQRLSDSLHLFTRNVFSSRQTSINGVEWKPLSWMTTAVAGGIGAGQGYFSTSAQTKWDKLQVKAAYVDSGDAFRRVAVTQPTNAEVNGANVSVNFQPFQSLAFDASHLQYLQPADVTHAAVSATTNQMSTHATVAKFAFGGSLYEVDSAGLHGTGGSLFAGRRITGWLDANTELYRSQANGVPSTTISTTTLREQVHPRVALLELITHSAGQTSASYGGQFMSNRLRLSLEYQNVFIAFDPAHPFRQALNLDATIRPFGNVELHVGSFVDPFGNMRYTVWMNNFMYRGRTRAAGGPPPKMGRYIVRGHVIDERGKAVSGAAVYIGTSLAYSDDEGRFFVRFDKQSPQTVRVATDEFTAPGYWQVLKAPASAMPQSEGDAVEIEVVVRRLSPQAYHELQRQHPTETASAAAGATGG